jgi:hypothetical protein
MLLRELFIKTKRAILEGGNAEIDNPDNPQQPHRADRINLEVHNRTKMVGILDQVLHSINQVFTAQHKQHLWNPALLKSREFLSGSSLHFFNIGNITDDEFKKVKPLIGDIDTQCDKNLEAQVGQFLTAHTGRQIGNSKLLGFSNNGGQYNALFQLANPPIKVQIDFEFGEYDQQTQAPTDWYKFSHSSEWADLSEQIKGVFHKYLYRAMTRTTATEKYVQMKTKIKGPVYDNNISFAVHGTATGGGLTDKYQDTGKTHNGLPLMKEIPTSERPYITDLAQQFERFFGHAPSKEETELQKSFTGTIQLMNANFDQKQNQTVAEAFIDLCFEPGSQMINRDDPVGDGQIKEAAIKWMIEHLQLPNPQQIRKLADTKADTYVKDYQDLEAFKKANPSPDGKKLQYNPMRSAAVKAGTWKPLAESENPNVVQSKRKGIVHLEKMKDSDFLDLLDELKTKSDKFHLNNIPMNVKVDGFGGRFGMDENGKPYAETSRSGPKFQSGQFMAYAKSKGVTDPEQLKKTQQFDDWFDQMLEVANAVGSKLHLKDTKIHVEVLYLPFAEKQADGRLKFVGIHYDELPKGITMALVPLFAEVSSTGQAHPNSDQIISQIKAIKKVGSTMIIDNSLTTNGTIDATAIIPPVENIEALRSMVLSGKRDQKAEAKEALQKVKDELGQFIIKHPGIVGKDVLGKDYEGIILNTRNGPVKITSPEQKQVIADKNAAIAAAGNARKAAGQATRTKTAVVTAGSFVGHKGHEQLVNLVLQEAGKVGGDPYVYISPTMGPDDPIPPELKLATWKKLYPQHAGIFHVWQEGGTPVKKIEKELVLPANSPYKHVILMVGTDRYAGMKKWMDTLSKRMKDPRYPGSHNEVTFDTIETKREAEHGGTGISFTQCRQALQDPNKTPEQQLHVWLQAFDEKKLGRDWIHHLMNVARKNMGIADNPTTQEDAAGVGIITKQNSTVDVNKSTPNKNLKAYSLVKEANKVIREMRAREFVKEGKVTHRSHEEDSVGQGVSRTRDVGGYDRVYHMNRLMMAMGVADGRSTNAVDSPAETWAQKFNTHHPYTKEEDNKIKAAMKTVPTDGAEISKFSKSVEPKDTNTTSPVAKPKKNKYGI